MNIVFKRLLSCFSLSVICLLANAGIRSDAAILPSVPDKTISASNTGSSFILFQGAVLTKDNKDSTKLADHYSHYSHSSHSSHQSHYSSRY